MKLLEVTLKDAAENLALDEALLNGFADSGDVLRIWEAERPAVIIGRASRWETEVNRSVCQRAEIPVLRRCSGGAAVVIGPGCLMYSVILQKRGRPALTVVDQTHRWVLGRIGRALRDLGLAVRLSGTSDLTLDGRKFSGNSLRCKREVVLYHGTLLYDADIAQIESCLRMPPRLPEYRRQRGHRDFLVNLPVNSRQLRDALVSVWECHDALEEWPRTEVAQLVAERYRRDEWNFLR